jgi:hypothetical protein
MEEQCMNTLRLFVAYPTTIGFITAITNKTTDAGYRTAEDLLDLPRKKTNFLYALKIKKRYMQKRKTCKEKDIIQNQRLKNKEIKTRQNIKK